MKTCFYAIGLISLIIFSFSCKKGGDCEEVLYITNSSVAITFKDSVSNKYLYSAIHPMYNKDSLKIYNPQGEPLFLLAGMNFDTILHEGFFVIDFGALFDYRTDSVSFNREICKNYVVQYSYNEKDTVTTCFKSKDEKCGSVFSTLKVYHRGRLLASENNTTNALVTITKN